MAASRAQTPGAIDFKDHVLIDEVVQKGGHEQWLPLGAPEQRLGKGRNQFFVSEAQCEMAFHLRPGQSIEPQFAAASMNLQILMQPPNRMSTDNGVGRAIGCENKHRSPAIPSREARQNVQRREVAPVQVLENDGQRAIRAQYFQQGRRIRAAFAPVWRRTLRSGKPRGPSPHGNWASGATRSGHGPELPPARTSRPGPDTASQGIDQRVEGFIGAETLRAAPVQRVRRRVETAARSPSR